MNYYSRDETEISGPGCSRDESECEAFGDDWQSRPMQPQFAGWFDSILSKTGIKKKIEKDFSKQAGKPIKLTLKNPTAGQIASGVGKSAVMLAPIVLTAGGAGLLAAPALAAAAPIARTLAPAVKTASQVASAAKSAGISLTTSGGLSLKTSAGADALVKAANLGDVKAKAQIAALVKPGLALNANEKLVLANVKAAQVRLGMKAAAAVAATPRPAPLPIKVVTPPKPVAVPARVPFAPVAPLANLVRPATLMVRPPVMSPLAAGIQPSAASMAALAAASAAAAAAAAKAKAAAAPKLDPNAPKYLVLDSGQVLADAAAKQRLPGFVVRFNGSVGRQ